jgi:hypothetical protein
VGTDEDVANEQWQEWAGTGEVKGMHNNTWEWKATLSETLWAPRSAKIFFGQRAGPSVGGSRGPVVGLDGKKLCWGCQSEDHVWSGCPQNVGGTTLLCWACGKPGHSRRECPDRTRW